MAIEVVNKVGISPWRKRDLCAMVSLDAANTASLGEDKLGIDSKEGLIVFVLFSEKLPQ